VARSSWPPFISPTVAMLGCPARSIAKSVDPEKAGEAMYRQVGIARARSRRRNRRESHRRGCPVAPLGAYRNQRPSGTPKPCFGRCMIAGGKYRSRSFFRKYFPVFPRKRIDGGSVPQTPPLDGPAEERGPPVKPPCSPVDLGQDVVWSWRLISWRQRASNSEGRSAEKTRRAGPVESPSSKDARNSGCSKSPCQSSFR
jgi:hypothetical protein